MYENNENNENNVNNENIMNNTFRESNVNNSNNIVSENNTNNTYNAAHENNTNNLNNSTYANNHQNFFSQNTFRQNSSASENPYNEYCYSVNTNIQNPNMPEYNQPKKKIKNNGLFKKAVSIGCAGILFGIAAGTAFSIPSYMMNKELQKTKAELQSITSEVSKPTLSTTTDSISASGTNYDNSKAGSISTIAKNCLPSVVSITNKSVTEVRTMFGTYQQDSESSGSGIIIGENKTELLIVTNYHVVSGSKDLSVVFSYDEDSDEPSLVSARLKGYVSDKDLAVISVSLNDVTEEMRSQIKIATIGDSSKLSLGQEVVAIGNALGYGQSVTTGIISALNREVTVSDENGGTITNKLIQTDAAINPGNSGGALLNMNGELIGINSVKVSSSSVEGMGYAIPISDVQSIIEELMLKETRDVVDAESQGYIGIAGTDVTTEISETYGMPVGIYINTIYDDSPAKAAGLSKGNIITKFDGQTVKSMSELKTLLTYYKSGETVNVIAMIQSDNGYTEKTFSITLTSKEIFGEDAENEEEKQETPKNNYDNYNDYYSDPFESFWNIPW